MARIGRISGAMGAIVLLGATACGGRFADADARSNDDIVEHLLEIPGAQRIAVERYGYGLPDGREEEDFFTEVVYDASALSPDDAIAAVAARLGDDWSLAGSESDGEAAVATFRSGDARVAVTTWDGGFDVTVAADGAELDGTPLAL